jgi:hypothetical protein
MVASIPPKAPLSPALRRAHELVAATLLDGTPAEEGQAGIFPPLLPEGKARTAAPARSRPWKGWLFTVWVTALAAAFLVYLLYAL